MAPKRTSGNFGGRTSVDISSQARSAQHFQLDQCLSAKAMEKIIYAMTTTKEAMTKSRMTAKSSAGAESTKKLTYGEWSQTRKAAYGVT